MRNVCVLFCLLCLPAGAFGQDRLSWETQEDSGGTDRARAVALSGTSLVMVGNSSSGGSVEFVIQALGRTTGAVRWSDQVPGCCGVTGVFVAGHRTSVFGAGSVSGPEISSTDLFVRAYDTPTGALLWEKVWDTGQDDQPQGIAASQSAVVVVGYGGNTPGHSLDFIVRAYDPLNGDVLWENRVDRGNADEAAWTVAIDRNRVFVAGTTLTPAGRDLILRAYNLSTGKLTWETGRPVTSPIQMKALSGRVFVGGSASNRPYLAAFDGKRGTLLWQDDAAASGAFRDLAVEGDRVVAAGTSGSGLLVRAYDAAGGSIEWQDQPAVASGFGESALAVAVNAGAVYIAGRGDRDFSYSEVLVRAYQASNGALLWDDRSHRGSDGASAALDVVLGKNRLFVAGYAASTMFTSDFLVRAYDIRRDGAASSNDDDETDPEDDMPVTPASPTR